jgi:hypothetical protein
MKTQKIQISLIALLLATLVAIPFCSANSYLNLNEISIYSGDENNENITVNGPVGSKFKKDLFVTNHGSTNQEITIYKNEADYINGKFHLSSISDSNQNFISWIELNTNSVNLAPEETITIPLTITYPENAGIGKHYGAVLISQRKTTPEGNTINIDQGIRIQAEVTGAPKTNYKLINSSLNAQNTYSTTIVNSGNTNLRGNIEVINQALANTDISQQEINLTPGEDQKITLNIEKSSFGPEHIVANFNINNSTKAFLLSDQFVLPASLPIIIGVIALALIILLISNRKKRHLSKRNKLVSIFLLISIMSGAVIFSNLGFSTLSLYADTLLNQETTYLTTIKWGNFNKAPMPEWVVTNWIGRVQLDQGEMYVIEKLHNESNDHLSINRSKNTLNFNNTTGPDNDGIILLIKTNKNLGQGQLVLQNTLTGEEILIPLENTLTTPSYIQYKQQQIEIQSELAPNMVNVVSPNGSIIVPVVDFGEDTFPTLPIIEIESTSDLSIIADREGTPAERTKSIEEVESTQEQEKLLEEVSLLKEIIKEIPASPDILSEIVLSSTYVHEIKSQNQSTIVKGSPKLISKLKNTPLTIQEITSSPDMNFIFVPSEKVKLTPQTFSFKDKKLSSQELDEMVFVQKKGNPWDIYLSITDFISVSGKHTIPAKHITITPGPINLINQGPQQSILAAGNKHTFIDKKDEAVLVSIIPLDKEESTFSIKPRISVEIPPNTPPGLYKAEITIRAI